MKRLFWDKRDDSFFLRDNPEWCSIVIDKDCNMTIIYEDSFKKKTLTAPFKKVTSAMNVARIVYDRLSCHKRGKKENFDVDLPGQKWIIK